MMAAETQWEDGGKMGRIFLNQEKSLLISMVQGETPERIMELMDLSDADGADGYGMQFERLKLEYHTPEVYRQLFSRAGEKPTYVTNYRVAKNQGKSDEELAEELLLLAECGATLCDVMGDYFDPQPDEITHNEDAIQKQMELIEKIHQRDAQVIMSNHIGKFLSKEEVLEIAMSHQQRRADISKIVANSNTMEEQIENLNRILYLKKHLKIPFLFITVGECSIIRRIGGTLGNCMSLCVAEHDALSSPEQPLLQSIRDVCNNI